MELPKAMGSEQAVLGAMIAYPSVASEVVDLNWIPEIQRFVDI